MTVTLAEAGHPVPTMPMGQTCAVHVHREWVPIERHHVHPVGLGGPNVEANIIAVCCNGHYSIHEYLRQLILHNGAVSKETSRHFGAKVRGYATRGWNESGRPTRGGGGE